MEVGAGLSIYMSFIPLVPEAWRLKELTGNSKCKRWRPEALRRVNKEARAWAQRTWRRARAWWPSVGMACFS